MMGIEMVIAIFLGAFLFAIGGIAYFRINKDYKENQK